MTRKLQERLGLLTCEEDKQQDYGTSVGAFAKRNQESSEPINTQQMLLFLSLGSEWKGETINTNAMILGSG